MYKCIIGYCCFRLPDGSLMEITKVYPLDAVFDSPEDVPEDVSKKFDYILRNKCFDSCRYKSYK